MSVIFLGFFTGKTWAAMSLSFNGLPANVDQDNAFEINVSLVDAPINRTYYLRAALFEEGKTNYFGYTYNHSGQWHNSPSQHTEFLEITTNSEGSWSGQLKAKADLNSSYFKGSGKYQFKIGRYTVGGSGPSWSNNTGSITINYSPPPSSSPSPEPDPTPESEPESTSSPMVSPSPKATGAVTTGGTTGGGLFDTHDSEEMLLSTEGGEILGMTEPEASEATESKKEKNPFLISIILIVLGLGFVGGTGVVFYKQRGYNETEEENGET